MAELDFLKKYLLAEKSEFWLGINFLLCKADIREKFYCMKNSYNVNLAKLIKQITAENINIFSVYLISFA